MMYGSAAPRIGKVSGGIVGSNRVGSPITPIRPIPTKPDKKVRVRVSAASRSPNLRVPGATKL